MSIDEQITRSSPRTQANNSGIGNIDNVGIDGVFLSVTSEFDFDDGSLQV